MARTFFSLLNIADIDHEPSVKHKEKDADAEPEEIENASPETVLTIPTSGVHPSLHYNIQIHLPATKDIEVYNSIFKSLKEHLIG